MNVSQSSARSPLPSTGTDDLGQASSTASTVTVQDTLTVRIMDDRLSAVRVLDATGVFISPLVALLALYFAYRTIQLQRMERTGARYRALVMDRAVERFRAFQDESAAHLTQTLSELEALPDSAPMSDYRECLARFSALYRTRLRECDLPTLAALMAWGDADLTRRVRAAFDDLEDVNSALDGVATTSDKHHQVRLAFYERCSRVLALLTQDC